MQTIIELIPHKGIQIGNKVINLGDKKSLVLDVFNLPAEESNEIVYLDDYELSVSFDLQGQVNFIECLSGPKSEKTSPLIYGYHVFQTAAKEIVKLLTERNQGEIRQEEGSSYAFLDISVRCYRPSTPRDIQEEIDLMKKDDSYEDHREWLEEDLALAQYFQTVGIGVAGYYDNLD